MRFVSGPAGDRQHSITDADAEAATIASPSGTSGFNGRKDAITSAFRTACRYLAGV